MTILQLAFERDSASGATIFDGDGYPVFDDAANVNANTFLEIQNRVQNEVLGSPTTQNIQDAINDAILEYERESFWFNQIRYLGGLPGSGGQLTTVQGQEFYSYQDLPILVSMPHITKMLVIAFSNRYPLVSRTFQWIDDSSVSTTWQGLPTDYAIQSGSLRLYPVPDAAYPLILDGIVRFRPLVDPADYNCWTNEAEAVIRTEAKRLLFKNIIRDQAQADAMELDLMGDPRTGRQGYLPMLRRETTRRPGGPGKLRASRSYF